MARGVGNSPAVELPHVSPNRDIWEVVSQDSLAVVIDLTETDRGVAGPIGGKGKAPDA
jgi:hypothetical protein